MAKKRITGRITLRMVMDHMQAGFSDIRRQFQELDRRLTGRMDVMEKKLDSVNGKLDAEIADNSDFKRWINSHDLPKRVSRLEDKVFAGVDA